ncbi:ATP-binding protein [Streptomyces sp. NPDC050844]|uniref:ATP-binding protein n=1 Tax=Streptomyces sp. NPDC050844 TaxID=3155790 RepID=UPI0033F88E0B
MLPMTRPDQQATRLWKMQFTSTPKCIALVRRQVGKALADWGYGQDDIDRTLLVCSELATNAVQHGHRAGHLFEVQVAAERTDCLVEVSDPAPRPPRPVTAGADDEHGRGLQLVAALAEETGHRPRSPIGKTVWARLLLAEPMEMEETDA